MGAIAIVLAPFELNEHAEFVAHSMPFFVNERGRRTYFAKGLAETDTSYALAFEYAKGALYKDGPITVTSFGDAFNVHPRGVEDFFGEISEFGVVVPDGVNGLRWIVEPESRDGLPELPAVIVERIAKATLHRGWTLPSLGDAA
jgi:hypothetical protein